MLIEFEQEYLHELFDTGKTSDKSHRFQPQIVRNYIKRVLVLKRARSPEELYPMRALHYEVLKGDKAGISSVRINNQYRLEFIVREAEGQKTLKICRLTEISNHYA